MTEVADRPSDAALADAVRGGDLDAYRELYTRHLAAARRVAAAIAATETERDDLIAEAFTQVLRILRSGGGPDDAFRPYLLATIRNTMIRWHRRDALVSLVSEVPDAAADDVLDTRMLGAIAAAAFATLPPRWQTVLWRTEIDGESPAELARPLELTPNGVSALAYRAREGLRQAYLDQYVAAGRKRACRSVGGQLAKWVRGGVTERRAQRITAHLDRCADCRELAAGLRRLNEELPATVAPPWASTRSAASSGGAAVRASTASALSWVAAVKTAAAGAALVATVAIGGVAPAPAVPPAADGTTPQPAAPRPAEPNATPREAAPRPSKGSGAAPVGVAKGHSAKKTPAGSPARKRTPANGGDRHPGRVHGSGAAGRASR